MQKGEIVELVIRRNHISISELSRKLKVSRRSIYNWFTQESLSREIIYKIGEVLHHDFSVEFPDMFDSSTLVNTQIDGNNSAAINELESVNYWRNKYINLLEKHNNFLINNIEPSAATL
ncbi:helix-turn-helix domain-containing protein [Pedobacter sp. P351]|uniref:helix-turn-helix domain-containing protein n=1 Tax=Pedobacter superstes TaxID=3133441 RepID=UPI0030B68ECA